MTRFRSGVSDPTRVSPVSGPSGSNGAASDEERRRKKPRRPRPSTFDGPGSIADVCDSLGLAATIKVPFQNLLMLGFMMWMAGSTVHFFSIGITFSALWQPMSALQGVGKVSIYVYSGNAVLLNLKSQTEKRVLRLASK